MTSPVQDPEEEEPGAVRQSAKASFVATLFGPVIGYGTCYELQHFVYDLWLASSLGGAKNASGTTLRGAVAGKVFSPTYWQTMHLALVDCVRQVGLPHLFITIAPLEASAPYHMWLQDELEKTLRERTALPGAETFHLAHLLFQVAEGLLAGTNSQRQWRDKAYAWKQHVFSSRGSDGPASGEQLVTEMFARLEFQDGKRRRHTGPSQSYHGSGRAHLHMLIWLKDPEKVAWKEVLRADLPAGRVEPELRSLVEGSQLDWERSGWPQREEATAWTEGRLLLQHPADAHTAHVRAWMPDVLGAMQCHMDVQAGDGRGLLLQYTASYTSKFSDQFATSWLNEEATDYHLARKILNEYHPLEPEMWLQLGNQEFRQVLMTPVVCRMVPRVPNFEGGPAANSWEEAYAKCTWRSDDHTLLDFLRLSNKDGQRRKNSRRVCVSAVMGSRLRDEFYGKWLLLNVPFRSYEELWDKRAALVPEGYRMLILCLLKRPGFFRAKVVREAMQLEGHREVHIDNVLAMLEGQKAVIDNYLSGEWVLEEQPQPPAAAAPAAGPQEEAELDVEQQVVVNAIKDMVMWALERRYPDDVTAEELEQFMKRPLQQAPRQMRPLCILGPAGSGKSTAVQVAIRRASAAGALVGIACPTGVLASSYQEQFPHLDVDTLHGMFLLHLPESQAYDTMSWFDFVVIDEVGQLSQETFERLMRLWDHAERRPALVFVGDFHQLRGMDATRATDSARWRQVVQRHLRTMRGCACQELKWKLELLRTGKPSKDQLHKMLRGHRAMPDRGPEYSPEPTILDMEAMLTETPHTTFVTITRWATACLNHLALEVLFAEAMPLGTVAVDPESNLDNYDDRGRLIAAIPLQLPIYVGARVTLTRNVDKARDFVNGMAATVMGMKKSSVVVQTKTGQVLTVFPFRDEDTGGLPCLPLRLGYATTLQKIQGATLDHATIWLDVANIEAAGYVALSRVRRDADWRFIGHLTPHHFTPASGV